MSLTIAKLQSLINSQVTFIIEFYAPWCGPCKLYGPKLKEFCDVSNIPLFAIDGDQLNEQHELYQFITKYQITAYPTTLIFKKGSFVSKVIGADLNKVKAAL